MKKRIKRVLKRKLLLFLGLEHTESELWAIRSAVDSSVSALAENATAVAAKLNELDRRADTYLNDIGRTRSTLIPMIDERLRVLEDKLSLIQEAAKPKEEKVIRHRRASEFKQAVERGLHQ